MSSTAGVAQPLQPRPLRIGEVASRLGTTTRTIRYYEEIGLLACSDGRIGRAQRVYSESEVERIAEILRLKDLLGLSLDAVREILEAEDARRLLRERFTSTEDPLEKRRIVADALGHIERQLQLVSERRIQLAEFERELDEKRRLAHHLLEELA